MKTLALMTVFNDWWYFVIVAYFLGPSCIWIGYAWCSVAIACREGSLGRWTVRPGSTALGAVTSFGLTTLPACLSECLHDQHCAAAEFVTSSSTCLHHDASTEIDLTQISPSSAADLFILSRCIWRTRQPFDSRTKRTDS